MSEGIRGAHAFVTGGGRGIGAAIARTFAEAGARVTISGRGVDTLQVSAASLRDNGHEVRAMHLDVADEASVSSAFADATAAFGPVGILVNNAGQAASGTVAETSLDTWTRVLAVNLTGAFLCSRAVVPGMVEAGRGRIVNVASTAGLRGVPHVAAYAASKHGLIGLTRSLALEVARRGITVNAVCPGYTESDMAEQAIEALVRGRGESREQAKARLARTNAIGRLLRPEEIAETVVWLCSDAGASITGETVVIGG